MTLDIIGGNEAFNILLKIIETYLIFFKLQYFSTWIDKQVFLNLYKTSVLFKYFYKKLDNYRYNFNVLLNFDSLLLCTTPL